MFDWYRWDTVVIYCGIALTFLYGILRPRKKTEWRSAGMAAAWVIALYAEMYGIPLTLYVGSAIFGERLAPTDFQRGHFWAPLFDLESVIWTLGFVVVGQLLILCGMVISLVAWRQLWRHRHDLSTTGLYRYIRHPQYVGFFLFIIGSVINWPTILTLLMAPALIWRYRKLAIQEECEAIERLGDIYVEYQAKTGRFFPKIG